MAQTINTNINSIIAQNNLNKSQGNLATSLQRLSSGLRINSAKDDAAGLTISDRFTSQIRGLNQAVRNANDGISISQVAEGALDETTNNLQRIRELAIQSANGSNGTAERSALQAEVSARISEIDRNASTTRFGSKLLLDGSFGKQDFQVGAQANETISISLADARAAALGTNTLTTAGTSGGSVIGKVVTGSSTANGIDPSGAAFTVSAGGKTSGNISYLANASAKDIAAAINLQSNAVGVTATATNTTTLSGLSAGGTVQFDLDGGISGAKATITATVAVGNDLSSVAAAINASANTTGISASFTDPADKSTLTLSTTDGRNIGINKFTNSTTPTATIDFGGTQLINTTPGTTDTAVKTGDVSLNSGTSGISLSGADTELFATATENSTFTSVSTVDLSTATGAQSALAIVDGALAAISAQRGDLGAVQNRLESTMTNLSNVSQNVTAAKSRITDADFAQETANMSKNQILQQAGISVLSQANSMGQQVLSLLK